MKKYVAVKQDKKYWKVVSMEGQHPNIKTEIIATDLDINQAHEMVEKKFSGKK